MGLSRGRPPVAALSLHRLTRACCACSVDMLYVESKVNGTPLKIFVDCGAQTTIMSRRCAERVGLMRLVDTHFSGMAVGVGTARILGRVHMAPLQVRAWARRTQVVPFSAALLAPHT